MALKPPDSIRNYSRSSTNCRRPFFIMKRILSQKDEFPVNMLFVYSCIIWEIYNTTKLTIAKGEVVPFSRMAQGRPYRILSVFERQLRRVRDRPAPFLSYGYKG
jgi:hypothetical protein